MGDGWAWKMAWRDSRGSRRRLLLFLSSMVLGVAALVAINSFGENLEAAINEEAKALLGADLSLERNQPFPRETELVIDSLGGEQARRVSFNSMAYFPSVDQARLATIRAQEGAYPFYGAVETSPPEAAATYLEKGDALVDGTLMKQFGLVVGDSVQIGTRRYRIAGELLKTPRESAAMMLFSPRIYIPVAELDTTLLGMGSRVTYEVFFRFEEERDVEALVENIQPHLRKYGIGSDTVAEEQEGWGEALSNLYKFLGLVGFMALLLGGIGVASAVHVYVKQRLETVAVLRCLGAPSWRTFRIYLNQALAMGFLGAVAGTVLGVGLQVLLPHVLADFLPVEVEIGLLWPSMVLGFGVAMLVTLLFALLPLLGVRRISPLRALRTAYEEAPARRDLLTWTAYGLLGVSLVALAVFLAPDWRFGLGYAGGVAVVFGLLAVVARGLRALARRLLPASWPYPWRQGVANLYRPNNQTVLLMLALGLGTFLIMTLVLVERSLLEQIRIAGGEGRPDMIMFDIQPDQVEGVRSILQEQQLPLIDEAPVVSMRLQSVKGRSIEAMRADSSSDLSWAHTREYRSTYRDHLVDSEELVAGTFVGRHEGTDAVPISIDRELAEEDLRVGLGDTLVWNVQGVPVTTVVGSMREIDWRRMQTNFFVVFPEGVLEEAPQMYVVMTRAGSSEATARLQRSVFEAFPNVSSASLNLVLSVFDEIFGRISFVIRFMALFSIVTGLLVLAGAVVVSRVQRVGESVLLKTLGASRKQVFQVTLAEYLVLGVLATVTGLLLALAGSGALTAFVFETPFALAPLPMILAVVTVTGLTCSIGLYSSRGIYARPPLEVLRAEA